jgi:16S rRNA (uracil1498-N3)-methyltransferase
LAQLQRLVVKPSQFGETHIVLTREQQRYLNQVLRLQAGQHFIAMNGTGQWWLAELLAVNQDAGQHAKLLEPITITNELPVSVTLTVALPKGSGFDEVVRQTTELGVSCIVPVLSDRTLLNPSPQKQERWRRIAQEAAEQSERQIVPTISEPLAFATYLKNLASVDDTNTISQHYLGVTRADAPHLLPCLTQTVSLTSLEMIEIAIGPEGGWTESEVASAIAVGFQPVTLGRRILRTVTAPIAALSLISGALEGMRDERREV